MSFTQFLSVPEISERYYRIKPYFSFHNSAYDVSAACQLRCQDCFYFASGQSRVKPVRDPTAWRYLFREEKARGVNFAILAGAEPSLVPEILRAASETIPTGFIASNGLKPIPRDIGYRINISVWGDRTSDPLLRPYLNSRAATDSLGTALRNYAGDTRAVFSYTFNAWNIAAADEPAARIAGEGHQLTFNVFSPSENGPDSPLQVSGVLSRIRDKMLELMDRFTEAVLYSPYNVEVHTHPASLSRLFGCPFPRGRARAGLPPVPGRSNYRSYLADLSHLGDQSCCMPSQSCDGCRSYGAGAFIVPANMLLHARSEAAFRAWLDYFDTYLSVFFLDYHRGRPLYRPAGQGVLNEITAAI